MVEVKVWAGKGGFRREKGEGGQMGGATSQLIGG